MKVRYTPRAFSDLDVIRTYIYQFSPAAAGRVVGLIEEIAKRLGDFPESGQHTDELDTRIAFSPRYPYRIYYRIVAGEIFDPPYPACRTPAIAARRNLVA